MDLFFNEPNGQKTGPVLWNLHWFCAYEIHGKLGNSFHEEYLGLADLVQLFETPWQRDTVSL